MPRQCAAARYGFSLHSLWVVATPTLHLDHTIRPVHGNAHAIGKQTPGSRLLSHLLSLSLSHSLSLSLVVSLFFTRCLSHPLLSLSSRTRLNSLSLVLSHTLPLFSTRVVLSHTHVVFLTHCLSHLLSLPLPLLVVSLTFCLALPITRWLSLSRFFTRTRSLTNNTCCLSHSHNFSLSYAFFYYRSRS